MADGTVKVEWTVDDQKQMAANARQVAALEKQVESLRRVKRETDTAEQSVVKMAGAFDSITGANLVGLTSTMGVLAAGAAIVKKTFGELAEKARQAGEMVRSLESSSANLTVLAGGDKGKLQQLHAAATDYVKAGGGNLQESQRFVAELARSGELSNAKEYAKFHGVVGAEALPGSVEQMKSTYGGDVSTKDILGKALAANSINPTSIPEILKATAGAGKIAGLRGNSLNEVMAAISATEDAMGSPGAAGDAIGGAFTRLTKSGKYKGMNLSEILNATENIPERQLYQKGFLGNDATVIQHLRKNRKQYEETLSAVSSADGGVVDRTFAIRPESESIAWNRRKKGDVRGLNAVGLGNFEVLADDQQDDRKDIHKKMYGKVVGGFVNTVDSFARDSVRNVVGPEMVVKNPGISDALIYGSGPMANLANMLDKVAIEVFRNTEAIKEKQKSINVHTE